MATRTSAAKGSGPQREKPPAATSAGAKKAGAKNAGATGTGAKKAGDLESVRAAILQDMLGRAGRSGWTVGALQASLKALGIDERTARLAFPRRIPDLLVYLCRRGDEEMTRVLEGQDLTHLKMGERVTLAVRTRLEVNAAHRDAVQAATAQLALPYNAPLALRALYATVDAIWKAVGDTSTDASFYTKRLTLAGVYSSTLVVWLADRTPDRSQTWTFLDQRIADVLAFGKVSHAARGALGHIPELLRGLGPARR